MSFQKYMLFMFLMTTIAWGAWAMVLFDIDPTATGWVGPGFFYLTLFVAMTGSLSLIGTWLRTRREEPGETLFRQVRIAFRHAVMLSGVGVVSLLLAANHALTWLVWLGVLAIVGIVEYVFLVIRDSRRA